MKKYDVFSIGSALVDLIVQVDDTFLEQIGLTKGEMKLIDEEKSRFLLEKIKDKDIKVIPGGSSSNTAAGIALLGGSAVFCGKIGDDEHGQIFETKSTSARVITKLAKGNGKTGFTITFITPDSERTFATHLGAAIDLKKSDIHETIKESKILHLEGYILEGPMKDAAVHAIQMAKQHHVKISIDLADPALVRRNLDELKKIAHHADIIFANQEEARAFTDLEGEYALHEITKFCPVAVVKLGDKGSLIKYNGKIHKIPAHKADAKDATGAGDMYAAGLLFGLTRNMPIHTSGMIASFSAAKVVEQIGARLDAIEIKSLL